MAQQLSPENKCSPGAAGKEGEQRGSSGSQGLRHCRRGNFQLLELSLLPRAGQRCLGGQRAAQSCCRAPGKGQGWEAEGPQLGLGCQAPGSLQPISNPMELEKMGNNCNAPRAGEPLQCSCFHNTGIFLCSKEPWLSMWQFKFAQVTGPLEGSSFPGLRWLSCCKSNARRRVCAQELINFLTVIQNQCSTISLLPSGVGHGGTWMPWRSKGTALCPQIL